MVAAALAAAPAPRISAREAEPPLAPEPLLYEPPAPGSYELPPIRRVGERSLLAPDGARVPLLGLAPGQMAVVSFVYAHCGDGSGCPLAFAVMQRLDRELARRPDLAGRVRLVSVSFDPARDTPERMGELARSFAPQGDWRFLTAADAEELAPILRDFGQDVLTLRGADGAPLGLLQHVLKVFLVDARGDVRNVYSAGLLSARLVSNDAQTVLGGEGAARLSAMPERGPARAPRP